MTKMLCHLALGQAYPTNLENGENMSADEQKEAGINKSLIHEDFMMGSADLTVYGITENGDKEEILKDGEWAIHS